tara:strand:+ start:3751 stop:5208 length:1458 start_codon:yes stop_codon:yes gene_type:complete
LKKIYTQHTKDTLLGVKWNFLVRVFSQISLFIVGIILMRILSPSDFGLLAMITVLTGFFVVFKDFGLGNSLIHKGKIDDLDINTIFWFSLSLGSFLTLLVFSSSSFIANFYNEPKLVDLTRCISLLFVIGAFGDTHFILLRKNLEYKKIFIVEISSVIISSAVALYLAYNNWDVWSLVGMQFSKALTNSIIIWIISEYKPKFIFSYVRLKEHWKFAYPLLGNKIFNYWTRNSDRFFIGKYLGSEQLGFYSRANNLIVMPTSQLISVVAPILFPSFAKIKDDKLRIKKIYLSALRMTTFLIFPLMGLIFVFAKPMVHTLFGDQWIILIPLIKIFTILGVIESMTKISGSLLMSQGNIKTLATINILLGIGSIIAFFIGSQYNIRIVTWGLILVFLLYLIPRLYYGGKSINCNLNEIFQSILPLFVSTVITIVSTLSINLLLKDLSNFNILLFGIPTFIVIWIFINFLINRATIKLFFSLIKKLRKI